MNTTRSLTLSAALLTLAVPASQATYGHAGSFNLSPPGTFVMRLNGTVRSSPTFGSGYDALDVDGNANFDGLLRITLLGGFTPANGNSFDLFNWGSESGSGPAFDLPALDPGLYWDTHTFTNDGTISVTNTPVPEPGTAGLIFLGAVCVGGRIRRVRGRGAPRSGDF